MAAMVQTMATEGGRSAISKLMAMPTAAPIKKIGKMTPPLNPDWMLRLRINILAIAATITGMMASYLKGDKGTQRHTAQDFETIEGTKK
jgi:hypothetical protein